MYETEERIDPMIDKVVWRHRKPVNPMTEGHKFYIKLALIGAVVLVIGMFLFASCMS